MRIPGDFGMMPPVEPGGKPRKCGCTGKAGERALPDVVEFSVNGRNMSVGITSRITGTGLGGGLDSGARARVEQRLASGFYETTEVLTAVAERLLSSLVE